MVDKQKTKAMTKKQRKDKRGNNVSIENNRYYNSDRYGTNPDQEDGLKLSNKKLK